MVMAPLVHGQKICPKKNFLLSYLSKRGIDIHKSPIIETAYCRQEWGKHGTCCNTNKLLNLVAHEKNSMSDQLVKFANEVKEGRLLIERFRISYRDEWNKFQQQKRNSGPNPDVENHHKAVLDHLDVIHEYWLTNGPIMVEYQQQCLKELHAIRSSAMCSICSGRIDKLSIRGKLIVPEETCNRIVDRCVDGWQTLLTMLFHYRQYRKLVDQAMARKHVVKGRASNYVSPLKSLAEFAESNNLQGHLKACKSPETCNFKAASTLCSTFVSIVKPSYMKKTISLVKSWQNEWSDAFKKFGRLIKEGFEKFGKETKKAFVKAGKEIKKGFTVAGSKIKSGLKTAGSKVKSGLKKVGNKLKRLFRMLKVNEESRSLGGGDSIANQIDDGFLIGAIPNYQEQFSFRSDFLQSCSNSNDENDQPDKVIAPNSACDQMNRCANLTLAFP